MVATKESKEVPNDIISSKMPNGYVLRTLEQARKKQQDLILVEPNDVFLTPVGQKVNAQIQVEPLVHFV